MPGLLLWWLLWITSVCHVHIYFFTTIITLCTYRPINFINETKDRWVYCAAFGMLVNLFIFVVIHVSEGSANSVSAGLKIFCTSFDI